jgi:hypothetical protein
VQVPNRQGPPADHAPALGPVPDRLRPVLRPRMGTDPGSARLPDLHREVGVTEIIICAPSGFTSRRILRCRKCKRRTRHLVTQYSWYDPTFRCLAHDPIRVPNTYRRSPERTRAAWKDAMTRREAHEAVVAAAMAELGSEVMSKQT